MTGTPQAQEPAPDRGGGLLRIRADLGYDGTAFHGWARQPGLASVQESVERALATVLRLPEVRVTCAGRTDAGVHARGQVVHFDVPPGPHLDRPERILRGVNAVVGPQVWIHALGIAPAGFDARFAALWRRYSYTVWDGHAGFDPLQRGFVVKAPGSLDVASMGTAVRALLGEHDFLPLCKPRPGASTVRRILDCSWTRADDGLVRLRIRGDAFCHSMVRSVVGASMDIGLGRRPPEWLGQVIAVGAKDPAVRVAPAHGLVLEEVGYPGPERLAAQARASRVFRELGTRAPSSGSLG